MITFIGHLKVRPENAPAFEALLIEVRDLTLAKEPGVAWYSFAKSADQADTYVVIEVYQDAAAHAHHMEMAWVIASIPKSRALIEGGFNIRQYVSPDTEPVARRMMEH